MISYEQKYSSDAAGCITIFTLHIIFRQVCYQFDWVWPRKKAFNVALKMKYFWWFQPSMVETECNKWMTVCSQCSVRHYNCCKPCMGRFDNNDWNSNYFCENKTRFTSKMIYYILTFTKILTSVQYSSLCKLRSYLKTFIMYWKLNEYHLYK